MIDLIKEVLQDSIGNFTLPDMAFTLWKLVVVSVNLLLFFLLFKGVVDKKKVVLIAYLPLLIGVLAVMNIPFAILGVFSLFLLSKLISEKSPDFYFILISITSLFVGSGNVLISELFFIIILLVLFLIKKKDE
jgi:hypothetical protein